MKMIFKLMTFAAIAIMSATSVVFLAGCGGWSDSGGGTPANVAGTWTGARTSGNLTPSVKLILAQSGSSVSGTYIATPVSGGIPVSGTVDGNSVAVSGSTVAFGVPFTVTIETSVSGESMTGTETDGLGNPPLWNPSISISLNRASN